jgi:hypothetical protein
MLRKRKKERPKSEDRRPEKWNNGKLEGWKIGKMEKRKEE